MESAPSICIIGAGFSGICAAIQLRLQLNLESFTIFEENAEVGGTWFVNTYPGCACDVPSYLYSFSFEQNPNWSKAYSSQQEILEYLKNIAEKYDLYPKTKLQHRVSSLEWNENRQKWLVVVLNIRAGQEIEKEFDIIVTGVGGIRIPNWPSEFNKFSAKVHSAQWNSSVELKGKTVAIVGTGTSAVQIIPQIVDKVGRLLVYQRRPAWVVPRLQLEFPSVVKWAFATIPGVQWALRNFIFWSFEMQHSAFKKDTTLSKLAANVASFHLNRQIKNENLKEKLTPNYVFGCKRVAPSNEYYPALARNNVKVITSKITNVTKNTIENEDGTVEEPDVLILATGYKVQDLFLPLKITGKGGIDIFQKWKEFTPNSYAGIVSSDTPNMFFILGPNTGLGHNSIIFSIECQVNFMIQLVREIIERKATSVTVRKSVEDEFMKELQTLMKSTVWGTAQCGSFYADEQGRVTTLWPKNLISYYNLTKTVNFNHFEFKY